MALNPALLVAEDLDGVTAAWLCRGDIKYPGRFLSGFAFDCPAVRAALASWECDHARMASIRRVRSGHVFVAEGWLVVTAVAIW